MSRAPSAVVDASAVLALLGREQGHERVQEAVENDQAAISAVNLSEVVSRLAERGVPGNDIRHALDQLELAVIDFDSDLAYEAGLLRPATRHAGLGLGDRACLALGQRMGLPVLTADRAWSTLTLPVRILLVR